MIARRLSLNRRKCGPSITRVNFLTPNEKLRMKKSATLILLGLACVASQAQQPPAGNPPREAPPTLKVDVKLVNVYVTVTDAHGGPVAGLKKENFTLQEDGRDQTISVFDKESAVPLSIALAVDTSLSTRHDLPLEQISAKRFARAIMCRWMRYRFLDLVKRCCSRRPTPRT